MLATLILLIGTLRTEPLVADQVLTMKAHARAELLCNKNQWSHDNWLDSFKDYPYRFAGENLAKGYGNIADEFLAWKASPTHLRNMVNPNFTKTGYATSTCGISVQLFAGK